MNYKDKTLYVIKQKGKCINSTCPYTEEAAYKLYKIVIQHALEQGYLSEQELFDLIL